MKHIWIAAATISMLAACNGAPPNEKILTELCTDLFTGDARAESMIRSDAGTDLASYCACYAVQTVADGPTTDLHKEILVAMTDIKKTDSLDVEEAANRIESGLDSGALDGFNEEQFEALGEYFEDLAGEMYEAGGTCPAS